MKQQIKSAFALAAFILLAATACKKDPADPTVPAAQPQQPNPLPASALIRQIRWSETDHYTLAYNDDNQPMQLISQWQFVEGDPTQIHTQVYDFRYDAQKRLIEVNQSGGFVTKYSYHGNLVHNAKDFYPNGTLANETVFIYAQNRIVQENYFVSNPLGEPPSVYKRLLGYDDIGNLTKVETYEQQTDLSFKLVQTNTYSDFDNKLNTRAWLLRYPFLPQVRWQFNNPRKETLQFGQDPPKTIFYTLQYNAQGLPVSNTETRPEGTLNAQFHY